MYHADKLIDTYYPNKDVYPGLAYPPVIIDIEVDALGRSWGLTWNDARFVGYISGTQVIEKNFVGDPVPTQLIATADDAALYADGIDVTRVVYKMVDQVDNVTPYVHDFLKLSITGPGNIIGPPEVLLIGGCIAVWVKAQKAEGVITLSAVSSRLQANDVTIQVMK